MSKQKKEIMERMAKKFTGLKDTTEKSMAINIMIAYQTGRQEGIQEERKKWEREKQIAVTV